jgi:sensor histidine kinase YesM
MTSEQIEDILSEREAHQGQTSGIGIPNVVKRLHLLYQGEERFTIHSVPGRGTVVLLVIPEKEAVPDHVPALDC